MRVSSLVRRLLLVAVLVPVPLFVSARHDALGHRLRERDAPAPGLDAKQPRARAIEENGKETVEEYQQYSWGYGYGYPPDEAEATSTEETSEEGTPATSKESWLGRWEFLISHIEHPEWLDVYFHRLKLQSATDNECNQQYQRGFRTCDVLLVAPFSHLEQYNDCDHRDGDHTDCASIAFQLNRDDHPTGINWYTTVISTSELIISPWRPQHHDSLGTGIPDCERFSQPVQWHLGRSQQWRGGGRLILTQ
ncbi:hypothetical protein HYQ46_003038 [Verticillium longisporum]|nr:hypothetical protein HYQ46_003038 [Verticillium longisporum]